MESLSENVNRSMASGKIAIQALKLCQLRMDVTSADSQSLSILGTSFPDRAPSHGPSLLYAQRENRLVIYDIETAVK